MWRSMPITSSCKNIILKHQSTTNNPRCHVLPSMNFTRYLRLRSFVGLTRERCEPQDARTRGPLDDVPHIGPRKPPSQEPGASFSSTVFESNHWWPTIRKSHFQSAREGSGGTARTQNPRRSKQFLVPQNPIPNLRVRTLHMRVFASTERRVRPSRLGWEIAAKRAFSSFSTMG